MLTWVAAVVVLWAFAATLLTLLLTRSFRAIGADGETGTPARRSAGGVDRLERGAPAR